MNAHRTKPAPAERPSGQTALVEPASAPFAPMKATRNGVVLFSLALAAAVFAAVVAVAYFGFGIMGPWVLALALVLAVALALCIHIAMEWERVVICRFGAFNRVAGPGLIFMVPIVEQAACHVDLRTVTTPFGAEKTLTSDLVPVDIDAVLFWMVWDAQKACMEVEDYPAAVLYVAQTAMRDAIGRMSVAEVALSREQLDKELKESIERETEPWGIAILSVKVRDIVIPAELQEVMSLEAQAEREKNARLVLASAEEDISEMIASASGVYDGNEAALKIRTMHLLYESIKKSGGTVVTVPSALSDGLGASAEDVVKALGGK
ncbi:slipin family protein [Rubneribacter badeniensis]|uniref:Slipin family protein n=1 Tax=Rubneribacter badeniensis TaxID=2070688 RepID=A0A9D3ADI0_9ACTN|nr:FtsH protease regulator HflC [Coriobacteriaceae bacterium CHKCI002]HJH43351.1 slipin family protein [Rubneribacter badeniensis]